MHNYVNMPISWIYQDEKWLLLLLERRMNPELGLDAVSLGLPSAWHKNIAGRLRADGLDCAAHLPFYMESAGSPGAGTREASLNALLKAAEIAGYYGAKHLVGHPDFRPGPDVRGARSKRGGPSGPGWPEAAMPSDEWLEHSLTAWERVLDASEARLFLENTYEESPLPQLALLEKLPPRAGACLDLGHWFSFAGGAKRGDLEAWTASLAPFLGHLHLHDNNGAGDEHLGLGKGRIPLEDFFRLLLQKKLSPGYTLEPHALESFEHSLAWLAGSEDFQNWRNAAS